MLSLNIIVLSKMNQENLKDIVYNWAKSESLVTKAYIFGSRARDDYSEDSDLDVAVEIKMELGDEKVLDTWMDEGKKLEKRLAELVPCEIQLELFDGENTPTILEGIKESSILVYEATYEEATYENET